MKNDSNKVKHQMVLIQRRDMPSEIFFVSCFLRDIKG